MDYDVSEEEGIEKERTDHAFRVDGIWYVPPFQHNQERALYIRPMFSIQDDNRHECKPDEEGFCGCAPFSGMAFDGPHGVRHDPELAARRAHP